MESSVAAVYEQARQLDKEEQLTLLERLVSLIRKSSSKAEESSLLSLSGLGKALWKDTDIDGYLKEERAW